ncbi:MAG: ImmA/IrrE family metallo-endopeptidase [Anaerolineaceae bacterium]|nr:ImmA/IrrE family metallo-endopeptidase [Anaerolineaceae bacterium]
MSMINPPPIANMEDAVAYVRDLAGLGKPVVGIVPLERLVKAFPVPIWMAELENLTCQRAALFMAEKTGQGVDTILGDDELIAGYMYANRSSTIYTGCILVEKRDPIVRRRFSVAHELGHYVLHFLPALRDKARKIAVGGLYITEGLLYKQNEDGTDELPSNDGRLPQISEVQIANDMIMINDPAKEAEANKFAATLLMPEYSVRQLAEQFSSESKISPGAKRGYLAQRLASEFLVSREAMSYRLASLNI